MPIVKIDSANYSLGSSHLATSRDQAQESLLVWTGNRRPDIPARAGGAASTVSLSSAALAALATNPRPAFAASLAPPVTQEASAATAAGSGAIAAAADAVDDDPFLHLVISMVEMLIGRRIRTFSTQDIRPDNTAAPAVAAPQPAAPNQATGFGIEYDYHAVHEESELTLVSASGTIKTADGKELGFTLDLAMTRSYREETSISLRAGNAQRKDPLVLNFNGNAAQLSDRRFAFDLDSNGTTENLALLGGGSGYLAIDRNANGRIDSGSELFGPSSDSGFGELAALDSDGNGWIDENDGAFTALRIWTPDAQGKGTLETLAQRKVGAIALGSIASPFELRGAGNGDLGAVVASGLFLAEDGRVGSVQEIDLTV
jgi:hypothetical protein